MGKSTKTIQEVSRVKWWAVCPRCYRERRTTKKGVMKTHRYWIAVGRYGTMVECTGSGLKPLGAIKDKEKIND